MEVTLEEKPLLIYELKFQPVVFIIIIIIITAIGLHHTIITIKTHSPMIYCHSNSKTRPRLVRKVFHCCINYLVQKGEKILSYNQECKIQKNKQTNLVTRPGQNGFTIKFEMLGVQILPNHR